MLNLVDYENSTKNAVKQFWGNREAALTRQNEVGIIDTGSRGAVTAGKNMDGFLDIAQALVTKNGLPNAEVHINRGLLTLPGFFRPTKLWDMLVMSNGRLIAALEFKSQVGPSFGNNFNNRTEEAIGTAHDLWTAYREGGLGNDAPRPYLGWIMLLEDCKASNSPVRDREPHFPVFPEFKGASYAQSYA